MGRSNEDGRSNQFTGSLLDGNKTAWSKQRGTQIRKCGVVEEEIDKWIENEEPWIERLKKVEEGMEVLRRKEKIEGSRFNTRYKKIRTKGMPKYILEGKKRGGEWIRFLARVRCGSKKVANKYWLGGERIGCRLFELGIDTLEHEAKECEGM